MEIIEKQIVNRGNRFGLGRKLIALAFTASKMKLDINQIRELNAIVLEYM